MKEAPPQKKGENIFGGPRLRQKKKRAGPWPSAPFCYISLELFALSRFRCLVLFGSDLG